MHKSNMCFSAGASFGAAAVLGAAGITTVSKTKSPSQIMFASLPLLFAFQQVAEGFEWLSFDHAAFENYRIPMAYVFLAFAQVLWPSWVPLAVWSMEPDTRRKGLLGYLSVIGFITSVLLACRLIYYPVTSEAESHHIHYNIASPQWLVLVSSVLYLLSTIGSTLSSTLKYMKALAVVMLIALIVTQIFYSHYLISVWCFFAAILSILIFVVLRHAAQDRSQIHSILKNRINLDKADW